MVETEGPGPCEATELARRLFPSYLLGIKLIRCLTLSWQT